MPFILISILLLTGCLEPYVKPTHYENYTFTRFHTVLNVDQVCSEKLKKSVKDIRGCATWRRMSKAVALKTIERVIDKQGYLLVCDIYSQPVQYENDTRTLTRGHEQTHCERGNYH